MSRDAGAVCLDASVVVRVLTNTASQATLDQWDEWLLDPERLATPSLMHFELCNALHKYTRAGVFTEEAVDHMLRLVFDLPLTVVDDDELHREAMAAARRYDIASVYDAHYLALAERLGVEMATADAAMHRRVSAAAPWVRLME